MEFMKYKQVEIGQRIWRFRKEKGLSAEDFVAMVQNKVSLEENQKGINSNELSFMENGRLFGNNKSFIPEKKLKILADNLDKSRVEIIFGNKSEEESFIRQLFYQVATNLHPRIVSQKMPIVLTVGIPELAELLPENILYYPNSMQYMTTGFYLNKISDYFHYSMPFYEELYPATRTIHEAMRWFAPLSYVMVEEDIEGTSHYHYDRNLLDEDDYSSEHLPDFTEETSLYLSYFDQLKILWEISKERLIQSFNSFVIPSQIEIDFKKLDDLITKWILGDFKKQSKKSEEILRGNELFAIGYEIYDMLLEMKKWTANEDQYMQLANEQMITIEYRTKKSRRKYKEFDGFKGAKTITNNWDLTIFDTSLPNDNQSIDVEEMETISEEVPQGILYEPKSHKLVVNKYNEEGRYAVIPGLLSNQRVVTDNIKFKAVLFQARFLMQIQDEYLKLMDRDEFLQHLKIPE